MRITGDTPIDDLLSHSSITDTSEDELMHWKYIKREKVKGKWKYYYDEESLKEDVKSVVDTAVTRTRSLVSSGKKNLDKFTKVPVNKPADKAANTMHTLIDTVKQNVHKYVAKVPVGDTYRYFYSDEAYQSYIKGKEAVDKITDKNFNATPSDTAKANAQTFALDAIFGGFGKAVYNVVAPAFAALQVALTTPKSFSELKKIESDQSNDEHQKAINSGYTAETYDYSMNCSFCTAAYDLRKRGYDVEANPISTMEGYTIADITKWYDGAKSVSERDVIYSKYGSKATTINKETRTAALEENLKKQGNGARGHLGVYWQQGGGHDVIWEVENGKVIVRDCQINETMELSDWMDTYLDYISSYDYVRTDNVEPTEEVLRTVRNRKSR